MAHQGGLAHQQGPGALGALGPARHRGARPPPHRDAHDPVGHPAMRRIRARRRVILDCRPHHVPLQERDRAPLPMRELDELVDEKALAGPRQPGNEDHPRPLGVAGERRVQIRGGIQEQHGGGRASYSGTPGRSRQRMPPEIWRVSPVIQAASSEARNTAAGAISCGRPMRPSGV